VSDRCDNDELQSLLQSAAEPYGHTSAFSARHQSPPTVTGSQKKMSFPLRMPPSTSALFFFSVCVCLCVRIQLRFPLRNDIGARELVKQNIMVIKETETQ
jgi:hypothetical protein